MDNGRRLPPSAAASAIELDEPTEACSLLASDSEDWASSVDLPPATRQPRGRRAGIEAELMRLLSQAVETIGLDWEAPAPPPRNRLDGRFLRKNEAPSQSRSAPFLPELHEEVAKSWNAPFSARLRTSSSAAFSSVDGAKDRGYLSIPPVGTAVASHLCPPSAGRRAQTALPSKACRVTSAMQGRAYTAAGQAVSALHTMAILQIFQADLLQKLDEEGPGAICVADLRYATDLALRAAKAAAQATVSQDVPGSNTIQAKSLSSPAVNLHGFMIGCQADRITETGSGIHRKFRHKSVTDLLIASLLTCIYTKSQFDEFVEIASYAPTDFILTDVPKPTLTVRPQSSVFTGDSVTLRCELDQSWDGWEFLWIKDSNTESPEAETKTINPVKVSDGGEYRCRARRGGNYTHYSEPVAVTIHGKPKPKVTIKPDHHVFRGETVTLRCDIYDGGVTSWRYNWYKDGSTSVFSERQEHTFSVSESDAGKYSCYGTETEGSHRSRHSDKVTLTVSDVPKPTLTVRPQSSVFTGDSVTLRCELDQSWDGWEFLWIKDSNTESPEAATKTIDPVKVSDGGEYRCRAQRGGYYTHYSKPVPVTIHDACKNQSEHKPDHHVFREDSVTLRCDIYDEGVTSWWYNWYKDGSTSVFSERQNHTFSSVSESDAGKYFCYGTETKGSRSSQLSDEVTLTVSERPKPRVSIKPDHHVFRGDSVTLRCDIYDEGVTSWRYNWYKDGSTSVFSGRQEHTFSVFESDAGKYSCNGTETEGSHISKHSDEVTLTVSDPKAVLSVSPQKWLTEGDPVTLICEVNGSSTGWTFSWFTVSGSRNDYELLSDSSRGAGGKYTVSSADLNHTGVYVCGAERDKTAVKTTYSNTQPLWVTGVSPPVSLIISPSRTQHFSSDSLSLSCEDQSNSDGWTVRRYTDSGRLENCSSLRRGSQTGSTCTISSTITPDTGVYWCQSESGEKYHLVNITVHIGVILESPVHPVTEGGNLNLRCLYKDTTLSSIRADFYKVGSLVQKQTTEIIIPTVSKSHEGFYYCKHPERGESPKSWISVRVLISNIHSGHTQDVPKPTLTVRPQSSVFTGDSVTLRCELDQSWDGWEVLWRKDSNTESPEDATKTISPVKVSDGGEYRCRARRGGYYTYDSEPVAVTIHGKPKPKGTIKPDHHVFRGDTVTLRCDIYDEGVTSWRYVWYKDGSTSVFSEGQNHTFSVSESDAGKYSCYGTETKGSHSSQLSDEVTLTVSERPKPRVSIKPDHHVFRGETVTLRCDIYDEGVTSWRYNWYKDGSTSVFSGRQEHTFSVSESNAGKYSCYGTETKGSRSSQLSDKVTLTVSDVPKPTLTVWPQSSVFTGDSVTLRCELDPSWDGWEFLWIKGSNAESPEAATKTISPVEVSDGGEYRCRARRGGYYTRYSKPVAVTIHGKPKPRVTIKPDHHVFREDSVTLRCDIYDEGVTSWRYNWYKDGSTSVFSEGQNHTFSVYESDAGKYSCYGAETEGSRSSQHSDKVTLTVSVPRAVLSVSPQKWLTEGDPVTLICEVNGSSTGWTFSWFTVTVSGLYNDYELLSDSSRGAGGKYTVSSADLNHTGVYVCGAERDKTTIKTTYSNTQPLWVTGVSPPVSLIISPSRTQHFGSDSLSLSCEDQSNSDGWTVRRYTDSGRRLEDCSSLRWGSQTGSTCTISSPITWDTGVYWCQSESRENYHPVNITVHFGVILESPVHPVTEGGNLTLRCLYKYTTRSNIRADFYKDGSLVQKQTTEMIIPTVSKSHEGFYYCKHPERGASPKSWISVRGEISPASGSNGLNRVIIGVTAGLTVVFLIIVFMVLLWRYRNNKGVRSESPSPVSHQQNISQKSEQNQSEAGDTALLSGTSHIYDSVDTNINKEISTDGVSGPTEITYAEIELKSTKKQKKKKENKGKNTESDDIYSKLKL
ncbi:basement membrane-specific heparan sulfate proteoglycan core protein-like [Rhinichthys klamathensis goyatoka]|uniref:basement membrane-specific heparan sulfate proteoglycan core protein-like n=1 Tax=Rhinichthys klamathensis goyatoka TaxID=3034132 RepID=UPI0024B53C95|nr:basement membrane-specific heparan sulfate proteoglycan core protein-like [Rhinichthys klamathensis goyatoka]